MIPVNVIHAPTVDTFDYLLFPEQHHNNSAYVQRQFEQFSSTLTDAGRRFVENAKQVYQQVIESDAANLARLAIRNAKALFQGNHILPLMDIDTLQTAAPLMQRYVMAQPDIRALYHTNRCDGYSDTYVDLHHGKIGEDHYDYRRVLQNMVQQTDDGWYVKSWAEDLVEGDRELGFDEKNCILHTWDVVKMFVEAQSADPTNPWGGKLG